MKSRVIHSTLLIIAFVVLISRLSNGICNAAPAPTEHVIVMVWDGLRPDSVTEQDTPTLFRLSKEGTFFAHHHPVYLSSTEVNGTALATGVYPLHSGVMANHEYRPDIELLKPIAVETPKAVKKGDELTGGKYLRMPTIAEMLRRAGLRTVVAGTKPVALLLDRDAPGFSGAAAGSVDVYQGKSIPLDVIDPAVLTASPFPEVADAKKAANVEQDRWTTRILIDRLWAGNIPAFTFLWMSEPDYAQHGSGPGSGVAKSALRSDDDNLAAMLAALDAAKVRDTTDVIVVSDHGFSTISRNVDLMPILRDAGFDAFLKFSEPPAPGQVLLATSSGSALLYVIGHSPEVIARLVKFLQKSDFAGVIFTKDAMEGTFALDRVKIDTPDAPDIVLSMRWSEEAASGTGMRGMICSESKKLGPGQGNHASLSRFDMHNTLIAAGPDFRTGFVDDYPSGNDDVAPTVLALLHRKPEQPIDGRVLEEALVDHPTPTLSPITSQLDAQSTSDGAHWKQYLRLTTLGEHVYIEEGNGHE